MPSSVSNAPLLLLLLVMLAVAAFAQVPTGALRGSVTDPAKALISGAAVEVKNKNTGQTRQATTKDDGVFFIGNLLPGEYELKVAQRGFKTHLATVTIQVGDTAATEIALEVGEQSETVVISGDSTAVVNTNDFKVDGVITRQKIDNLPLNGRNYLNLAQLEPGVRVSTGNPGDANSIFNVSIGGASADLTRLTVDGGSIVDYTTGGAGQNFSIESVQEFQISSFNFDLATGVTSVGAINIVTRTGKNELFGSAFAFYRDRNVAAYPVLNRVAQNPDPFFRRLQAGFSVGGPIVKDKLLWFFNLEDLNQDSVIATLINGGYQLPGGARPLDQFNTVTASPYDQFLTNARLDFRPGSAHNFLLRYSGDKSESFGPVQVNTLPSNWRNNRNNVYQGQGGWTWIAQSSLTNDLRFNWHYIGNRSLLPAAEDCPGCIGLNGPQLRINNSSFIIGNSTNAPQNRAQHRYETTDNLTWVKGRHLAQFGGTWEKDFGLGSWNYVDPAVIVVHDPNDILTVNSTIDTLANPMTPGLGPLLAPIFGPVASQLRIPLPASFTTPGARITYNDLLQLPLAGAAVGIGDGSQPPPFNADIARRNTRYRLYAQDTWRLRPNFTLKYGLSYTYETNLYNHDLPKTGLLSSLYGGITAANPKDRDNFAPALGFAYDVRNNQKTVVRGGFSMFYDTSLFVNRLTERALLGPLGNGRVVTPNDFYVNSIQFANLPTNFTNAVPIVAQQLGQIAASLPASDPLRAQLLALAGFVPGTLLLNPRVGTQLTAPALQTLPTRFTAANFLTVIGQQVPQIVQQFNQLGSRGVTGLDFFKAATSTSVLIAPDSKLPYSLQYSLGVQRELPFNMLLSTDFVFRRRLHTFFQADRNLFNRAASLGSSAIPRCSAADAIDPTKRCTNGPIEVLEASGRETYKALLVKLDKRFSNRYQFTASYSLSSNTGFNNTRALADVFSNPGPLDSDRRHLFSFNSIIDIPFGIRASLIAFWESRAPFSATLPGTLTTSDLDGDGTFNDLLPGFGFNQGNRDIKEDDLRALVANYNGSFGNRRTTQGGFAPCFRFGSAAAENCPAAGTAMIVTLPDQFEFGDFFQTYDLRLAKLFRFRERYEFELIAEAFNLFNISNKLGYGSTLNLGFGQATAKPNPYFGNFGPRGLEFGLRFKF